MEQHIGAVGLDFRIVRTGAVEKLCVTTVVNDMHISRIAVIEKIRAGGDIARIRIIVLDDRAARSGAVEKLY